MRGRQELYRGERWDACVCVMWRTVSHDKCLFAAGQGPKVHVSGLISYPCGRWVDIETIEPSKDGNWTLPKLETQIQRVLDKIEKVYPADKFEIVFTFDHSTIHTKLPEDALRVTQMSLNPGGKLGDKMRPTTWVSDVYIHA